MSSDRFLPAQHICTSTLHVVLQCLLHNMQLPLVVTPVAIDELAMGEIDIMSREIRLLSDFCGKLQLSVPCVSITVQRHLLEVLLSEVCSER